MILTNVHLLPFVYILSFREECHCLLKQLQAYNHTLRCGDEEYPNLVCIPFLRGGSFIKLLSHG